MNWLKFIWKTTVALVCAWALLQLAIYNAHGAVASVYCTRQPQACGGRFNPNAFTAAHRTLKCGTRVVVSRGGRSVTVAITDRGPFVYGRDIDLSCAAGRALHITGVSHVQMKVLH